MGKMYTLRESEAMNEELKEMIERACPTCGGGDYSQVIVNPDNLKKLLTLLVERDEKMQQEIISNCGRVKL